MADPPARVLTGQVLPPAEHAHLPQPPLSVPFLAEVRNWSERRQLESYVKLYRVQNEMLGLLVSQRRLTVELHRAREEALVQLENMETLREIEVLKINRTVETLRGEAEIRGLQLALEKERLQVQLVEVRLRRARLEAPPVERSDPSAAEQVSAALERIREMDAAFEAQRVKIIEAAGGEDALTDAQALELERIEILRRTQIEALYEDLM